MINAEIAHLMEEFKIPYTHPHCPEDWKDWYHYVLFDPVSKVRILYNICFNGKPGVGYVTDTLFVTAPRGFIDSAFADPATEETFGFSRNIQWQAGELEAVPFYYSGKDISFRLLDSMLHLEVVHKDLSTSFCFTGKPDSSPVYIPELSPYGKGFIGWGVMADYQMAGWLEVNNRRIDIRNNWYCYHDRNFGRFNWGNIGWTWFVVSAIDKQKNRWSYVMHQSNNHDYSTEGSPIIFIYRDKMLVKVFTGETVSKKITWSSTHRKTPILPGAMASVFCDRTIAQPEKITVWMQDERDSVRIEMMVNTHTELIVPDSEKKEFTFLKELSGDIHVEQFLLNEKGSSKEGFFYAELVH